MRAFSSSLLIGALIGIKASCTPQPGLKPPPIPIALPSQVKGINLVPVGDQRRAYGTPKAEETMLRLQKLGVNTLGILFEGQLQDLRTPKIKLPKKHIQEATQRSLLDAHQLGLATVLIPHLVIKDQSWRGHLRWAPHEAQKENAFWRSYRSFITRAAQIAQQSGVSTLSLGVELKGLSHGPRAYAEFHKIAHQVRRTFTGLLTYNANWDELKQVRFWTVVDLIGVNAYDPLLPDPFRGADRMARKLTAFGTKQNKPVLVLEIGYRSGPLSHQKPWKWPKDTEPVVDQRAQTQAYAAVLSQLLSPPNIRGLMFWYAPTDPDDPASEPPHGFNPLNKAAEKIMAQAFLK